MPFARRHPLCRIYFALFCVLALTLTFIAARFLPRTDSQSVELTLPDLVGTVYAASGGALSDASLYTVVFDYQADPKSPPGTVLSQQPAPGAVRRALPDRAPLVVHLTLSTGPRALTLTDLIGRDAHEISLALASQGLVVRTQDVLRDNVRSGAIVAVSPPEGTLVHEGEVVTLSRAQPTTHHTLRVPDVCGLTLQSANAALLLRGLRPEAPTYEFSSNQAAGTVISQRPLAGTLVAAGSRAYLVVSRGGAADEELQMEAQE